MEAKIKPEDLRIGNYVKRNGIVVQIDHQTFWDIQKYPGQYKPIELTEEWLLKFGFEKRDDQKFYHEKYDRTWVSLDSILVKWYGNALGGIMMLDYVHQLQNIFSLLTGYELTINEQK